MTHWATLWYAGAVVMQMGYEGQRLSDCELITKIMIGDIVQSYADPVLRAQLDLSMFPTNQFEVSCETEKLPTDERYTE